MKVSPKKFCPLGLEDISLDEGEELLKVVCCLFLREVVDWDSWPWHLLLLLI